MSNNSLILLDSILEKRGITGSIDSKIFELNTISEVLKHYALSQSEIESGIVDGGDDGGIDAFYTLVNGNLITKTEEKLVKNAAKIEVHIFTVKYENSYRLHPLESIDSSISELFDLSLSENNLKSKFNDNILRQRAIFNYVYRELITDCEISVNFHYISRGNTEEISSNTNNIKMKSDKIVSQTKKMLYSVKNCRFEFWGSEELLRLFTAKLNGEAILKIENSFQDDVHFVATVKLREFYKFISDAENNIKQYYFDNNVRNFLGDNSTNKDILDSLNQSESTVDFWLLNNGITIIVEDALKITSNEIQMNDVQIVNGLQTSYNIHRYISEDISRLEHDNRSVLVKIIKTRNLDIKNKITKSTNNQTAISLYSLVHSNDQIQKDIELSLRNYGISYERKSNQVADGSVVNPLFLAKAYCGLVLKLPFRAFEIDETFLAESGNYREIYNDSISIKLWPIITKIQQSSYRYLNSPETSKYTPKEVAFLAPLLSVCAVAKSLGKFGFGVGELLNFTDETIESLDFLVVISNLNLFIDEKGYNLKDLFNRYKVDEFLEYLAAKETISSVQAFTRKKDKFLINRIPRRVFNKIKVEYSSYSETFPGMNHDIAKKLKLSPYMVYKAIEVIRNEEKR